MNIKGYNNLLSFVGNQLYNAIKHGNHVEIKASPHLCSDVFNQLEFCFVFPTRISQIGFSASFSEYVWKHKYETNWKHKYDTNTDTVSISGIDYIRSVTNNLIVDFLEAYRGFFVHTEREYDAYNDDILPKIENCLFSSKSVYSVLHK